MRSMPQTTSTNHSAFGTKYQNVRNLRGLKLETSWPSEVILSEEIDFSDHIALISEPVALTIKI